MLANRTPVLSEESVDWAGGRTDYVERVLFVCSANICRSPMAAGLLQSRVRSLPHVQVSSAGFLPKGKPPAAAVIRSMRRRGLDLSSHLSNSVDSALENVPDLVLVMTGQHIRSLVDRDRRLLPRTFTLKEFVRLTEVEGQRTKNEDIASYVERVGRSRTFSEGFSWGSEDISDPYGRRRGAYERCAAEIERQISSLAAKLYPEE